MSQVPTPIDSPTGSPQPPTRPAGKPQRLLIAGLWLVMLGTMAVVVAAKLMYPHRDVAMLYPAAHYKLIDQDGKPFSDVSVSGRPYVCDFIFTICGGACPMMTHKLSDLQKDLPAGVQLVSFSIDPEHDTPAVLKKYAAANNAHESRWHFLTGTSSQVFEVARGMRVTAMPADANNPIMHDEHFILIDGDGSVRGLYDSKDPARIKDLIEDARYLGRSRGGRG